ncbi:MAG: DPP IV N-terminal domain-containing protein [Bacteroidales bacterium]|nr:DPP IV N-terminal domain-containing protein [Bacteroidales bacterium]
MNNSILSSGSLFLILFFHLLPTRSVGQPTLEDYNRADSTRNYPNLVFYAAERINWVDSTQTCWYRTNTESGIDYRILDTKKLSKRSLFNAAKFCRVLWEEMGVDCKPKELYLQDTKLSQDLQTLEFELQGQKFRADLKKYKFEKLPKLKREEDVYWGTSFDERSNEPVVSPDSSYLAYIKDYNLYVKELEGGREIQLSFDGSEGELYSSCVNWSPDSKYLALFKVRPQTKKYLQFVESTPKDQFLPLLHEKEYLRPGDALPIRTPALFDVEGRKAVTVEGSDYTDQFSLENLVWAGDSKSFSFEYNQRGHQRFQVIRIDAATGKKQIVLDEHSNTFIDYSSKKYRYDLKSENKILWASERDGWNHLYFFSAEDGKLICQVTKGEWLVREVIRVDEEGERILFAGSGMNADEDPYFIHYYWINFDGSGLKELTPEKMNHSAVFSPDHKAPSFVDTYSAADQPPLTVVRDINSGKVLMEAEKADISRLLAAGYILPEPFVAKARDGKTDIWGNIYRPSGFDPEKTYPIIEYIYAGPHSSFVQKSFRPYMYAFTGLAELGFVIVQIDGMGTSNRSKAFHDVCYQNLKDAGFEDRILWMKAAARKYPYMDTSRVGIFGGSAGGQNSTAALLHHPEFYKAAVSACGCHDNRLDKIWWNEQFMGFPIGPHYAENSNIEHADKLEGELLLIVGEVDDNVDPASTFRLADALIKAGKEFELVVLPGTNHTLGGDFGERKRRDFFIKKLMGTDPPDWNKP